MTHQQRRFVIRNATRLTTLASDASLADTWLLRLRGLLFRPRIRKGQGLILSPCNSIHMFGMLYPIDAVFVDKQKTVVGLVKGIWPLAVSPLFGKAEDCIELPSGTISDTRTESGDQIEWLED